MENEIQKQTPLSLLTIQTKARSLYETIKEDAGDDCIVEFSTNMFTRLKKHFKLHSVRVTGETASTDGEGGKKFVDNLDSIIREECYMAGPVFNVGKTTLFWKQMPEWKYIHKEAKTIPGFKALKDRLTLLLDRNVARFNSKPILIYHSENPRAFKNINRHTLTIYFHSNKKA
ncbi:tigger transposable element-derived protein 1-like [Watersipora subatra]|uniref:tigger transposable element-derived protein 1-like n=1 Tax=Watersipora subatra TaxID=2589382 RepID=UPI00355C7C79